MILLCTFAILLLARGARADCAQADKSCDGGTGATACGACVKHANWCNAASDSTCGLTFEDSECSSFVHNLTNVGLELLVIVASADWPEAEMICQKRGYNLLSLKKGTNELAKVQKYLSDLIVEKNVENFVEKSNGSASCDPAKMLGVSAGSLFSQFWRGSYYDGKKDVWMNTDGTDAIENDKADIPTDQAKKYQARLVFGKATLGVNTFMRPEVFHRDAWREYGKGHSKGELPKIICSKRKGGTPQTWPDLKASSVCLKGYQCANDTKKTCILGNHWLNSQLCDGKKDCPDGEDETPETCGAKTESLDSKRSWVFFPTLRRDPKDALKICNSMGMTLPSVRSKEEYTKLSQWPHKYFADLEGPSFTSTAGHWDQVVNGRWFVPLGAKGGAGTEKTWLSGGQDTNISDIGGTKAVHEKVNATDLSDKSGKILVMTSDGMKIEDDSSEQFFIVCEKTPETASSLTKNAPGASPLSTLLLACISLLLYKNWM